MVDQELLQAIESIIDAKIEPINKRLDGIDEKLDRLEETAEITKDGVNALLEWAEECGNVIKFPLPKIADVK